MFPYARLRFFEYLYWVPFSHGLRQYFAGNAGGGLSYAAIIGGGNPRGLSEGEAVANPAGDLQAGEREVGKATGLDLGKVAGSATEAAGVGEVMGEMLKAGQKFTVSEIHYFVNPEPPTEKSIIQEHWFRLMAQEAVSRIYPNRGKGG